MTGNALRIDGSSYVVLSNSKLKATADGQVPHNADGLYADNSNHLSIGGVPVCPRSRVCNTFDYNTGWGVYLQNTHGLSGLLLLDQRAIGSSHAASVTPGRSGSAT